MVERAVSAQMLLTAFKKVPDAPAGEEAARLAEALAAAAADDPALAEELTRWYQTVIGIVVKHGDVSNTISGSVDRAVQARDVSGSVIFH